MTGAVVIEAVRRLGLLAVLVATLVALALPTAASPVVVTTPESYTAHAGDGPLDYWLYVPKGAVPVAGRPLVVYLHGCSQNNATDPPVAFGTRWNELAAKVGAVVLYPLQSAYDNEDPTGLEGNSGTCWNWFLDKNMHRGRGEPKAIADLTRRIAAANHVDRSRVYVMGASAGADMANTVALAYSDVFRASAMFSGCAYAACRDLTGRLARAELRRHGGKPRPAIIFQGDADMVNNVAMGRTLLQQHLGLRRLSLKAKRVEQRGDPRAVDPGAGDPCVDRAGFPCADSATGYGTYPYTVKEYGGTTGRPAVAWWVIHGLNHAYAGGDPRGSFTDPSGPSVTRAAWEFFQAA